MKFFEPDLIKLSNYPKKQIVSYKEVIELLLNALFVDLELAVYLID